MESLHLDLKNRYGKATVKLLDSKRIEVQFDKAEEPVIIEKGTKEGCYRVSYPKITVERNGEKEAYITSYNILKEGLLWVLKKVHKHGKVLPEF